MGLDSTFLPPLRISPIFHNSQESTMSRWEKCPRCDKKLTYTESRTYNSLTNKERHNDVAWCETCWEKDKNGEVTDEELYDAYQLDDDIKYHKENK